MDALTPERPEADSTERLRARVAARADARNGVAAVTDGRARPRRSVLPWALLAMLGSFTLGLIANPWFEAEVRSRLPAFAREAPAGDDGRIAALAARLARLETAGPTLGAMPSPGTPVVDADAVERLARLEGRLTTLDDVATANATRLDQLVGGVAAVTAKAEAATDESEELIAAARATTVQARGVVLLAAARRALEAGQPLGGLGGSLAAQFGASPALTAVTALGDAPATPARLAAELERLAPGLAAPARPVARRDWLTILGDRLNDAVRPAEPTAGAATPDALLTAARAALGRGDVATALARIETLPPGTRAATAGWRAAAARWLAGQRGLAALEGAATSPIAAVPSLATASPATR